MTEAELSALTASLPGLMKLAAILKTRELTHRFDDNGEVTWSKTSDDLGRQIAIAFEQTAKALMQVMKERDEADESFKMMDKAAADLDDVVATFFDSRSAGGNGNLNAVKKQLYASRDLRHAALAKRPTPATQETENG